MKSNLYRTKKSKEKGFTIVEVLVTVIIVTLFVATFFQTYIVMETQRINVSRQAIASDVALSALKLITTPNSSWDCASSAPIRNETLNTSPSIGEGSKLEVFVSGPNGCTGTGNKDYVGGVVKVESKVTYSGGVITHATYVR